MRRDFDGWATSSPTQIATTVKLKSSRDETASVVPAFGSHFCSVVVFVVRTLGSHSVSCLVVGAISPHICGVLVATLATTAVDALQFTHQTLLQPLPKGMWVGGGCGDGWWLWCWVSFVFFFFLLCCGCCATPAPRFDHVALLSLPVFAA